MTGLAAPQGLPPRYLAASMLYGAVHKLVSVYDAKVCRGDNDKERVPMLVRDKVLMTAYNMAAAPVFWPVMVYSDVGKLELILRGEYVSETEKFKRTIDYLFPC